MCVCVSVCVTTAKSSDLLGGLGGARFWEQLGKPDGWALKHQSSSGRTVVSPAAGAPSILHSYTCARPAPLC